MLELHCLSVGPLRLAHVQVFAKRNAFETSGHGIKVRPMWDHSYQHTYVARLSGDAAAVTVTVGV